MRRRPFVAGLLPAVLAPSVTQARAAAAPIGAASDVAPPGVTHRTLRFPADHGAHPDTHIEWWYVTGWLAFADAPAAQRAPDFGFQVTFFRTRTELAETSASRFAARQLVFAHVALTDLAAGARGGGLMHDQRAGREGFGLVQTPGPADPQVVRLRDWSLERVAASNARETADRWRVDVRADRFALALDLLATQPVMLQGDAGYSQKGPEPRQASRYYSEPQLGVRGRVARSGSAVREVRGTAWLDHEWSNELMPAEAVGWDWVGFNLSDGAALMAFRLRRADGTAMWAGGSYRPAAGAAGVGATQVFAADQVRFEPLRRWTSPRTRVAYPVEWLLTTPAGRWRVVALQDDQELDSRGSTGSVYWEGVSALRREDGATVGHGYLELTGYAGKLRL